MFSQFNHIGFRCNYIRKNFPNKSSKLQRKTNSNKQVCIKGYLDTDLPKETLNDKLQYFFFRTAYN